VPILGDDKNLAPSYVIEVGNEILDIGVTDLITDISYESADNMADVAKLTVSNPDFKISDARVFQPGNELSIWMGYGNELSFLGRTIINGVMGDFPASGKMPTIQVTAYTKDKQMVDNAPPEVKQKKGAKKKGKGGRSFADTLMSEAADSRFSDYGFLTTVDTTREEPRNIIQKAGMNDYEFVQGLANISGFIFWVEGDETGNWFAYFLDPEGEQFRAIQEKKYTFTYNTRLASLMSFRPEQTFTGATTKLVYEIHDPKTGKVSKSEIEAEDAQFDTQIDGDPSEPVSGDPADGVNIKLYIGDFSIEVASGKSFKSIPQFEAWAAQWFRRQRENFMLARGLVIGTETLRARQTHTIEGVGKLYSGDYYFTRVKHALSSSAGYMTDFSCRKIIG
jgi:phage protein D